MPPRLPARVGGRRRPRRRRHGTCRPIRPDDGDRSVGFHERQSPESIYFRYFSPAPRLTDDDVERPHPRRLRRPHGVRRAARRRVGRRRPLRPLPAAVRRRGRLLRRRRHQGRGMATVLLEYLAAAARERGITAFTAEVLPDEPADDRRVPAGGLRGRAAASATASSRSASTCSRPPRPRPRSRPGRAGPRPVRAPAARAAIGRGHRRRPRARRPRSRRAPQPAGATASTGPSTPSTRNADRVASVRAYASGRRRRRAVDLAVVVVPAGGVPEVVEECGAQARARPDRGLGRASARPGPRARSRRPTALRTAAAFGIRLVGPNRMGVVNTAPDVRLHATFADAHARSGSGGASRPSPARSAPRSSPAWPTAGSACPRSSPPATRPTSRATTCSSTGRTTTAPTWSCSTSSRSATRASSPHRPPVARTKPIVAVKSGGAVRGRPRRRRRAGARHAPARSSSRPASSGSTRWPSCSTWPGCWPTSRCPRAPGGGGRQLLRVAALAADACVDAGLELADLGPGVRVVVGDAPGSGHPASAPARSTSASRPVERRPATNPPWRCCPTTASTACWRFCVPAPRQPTPDLVAAIAAARSEAPDKTLLACVFGPHPTTITPEGTAGVPVFAFPDDAAYVWAGPPATPAGVTSRRARWSCPPTWCRTRWPPAGPWSTPLAGDERDGDVPHAMPTAEGGPRCSTRRRSADGDVTWWRATPRATARRPARRPKLYQVAVKAAARSRLAKTEAGGLALDVHDESELRRHARPHCSGALGAAALARRGAADGCPRRRRGGRASPTTRWSGPC